MKTTLKVNKTKARKLFNEGIAISVIACKISLNNKWIEPLIIQKDISISNSIYNYTHSDFDTTINHFEAYNCNYESGYYAAYYIAS